MLKETDTSVSTENDHERYSSDHKCKPFVYASKQELVPQPA